MRHKEHLSCGYRESERHHKKHPNKVYIYFGSFKGVCGIYTSWWAGLRASLVTFLLEKEEIRCKRCSSISGIDKMSEVERRELVKDYAELLHKDFGVFFNEYIREG